MIKHVATKRYAPLINYVSNARNNFYKCQLAANGKNSYVDYKNQFEKSI